MNHPEDPVHLFLFIRKMVEEGLPDVVIETFGHYYRKVVFGETGMILDRDIRPLEPGELKRADELRGFEEAGRSALSRCVRIVLNGGLGTSMGLMKAKSLLPVKDGNSFLSIIVRRAEGSGARIALMDSFNTHEDTLEALSALSPSPFPITFLQHKFPKILRQEGFPPAQWERNPHLEWNPPGHGDIYTALLSSGVLESLLSEGVVYAFISNSDNLGADLDEALLGYFSEKGFPFMMEVSGRTPADVKGGHLARHESGRLILRESAQCPEEELSAFEDIGRYRYFNTNNIWVNLPHLRDIFKKRRILDLPMILNPKTLDPRDDQSPPVFQVETAMGAAISLFQGASAVIVPRSRFFPVKKCNDLLALRSDCYILTPEGRMLENPERRLDRIKISLDPEYYSKIDKFEERFQKGVPSLIHCESLSIRGNVFFGRDVTLRGRVVVSGRGDSPVTVADGSLIEGDLTL